MKSATQQPGLHKSARRIILAADGIFWFVAVSLALVFRLEFKLEGVSFLGAFFLAAGTALAFFLSGFASHLYRNRYVIGSLDELRVLLISVISIGGLSAAITAIFGNSLGVPRSIIFIAAPIFLLLSGGVRLVFRNQIARRRSPGKSASRALVYGAGKAAGILIDQLQSDPTSPYLPVVLLDDSPLMANRWIRGVRMGGTWEDLGRVVERFRIETVIVAIPSATSPLLSKVYSDAHSLGLKVVVLPSLRDYLGGQKASGSLRDLNIEDLIGRQAVVLDSKLVSSLLQGKRVLVTGAGGSIGSELCRQIADFLPDSLTMVDRDETSLLIASMKASGNLVAPRQEVYLADIRDNDAIRALFDSRRPEVVFHAAALKHLSMLEEFPEEAWKTNVEGTINVLEASKRAGVDVFVNISTDKAADPISSLGRSKKIGEQVTAWYGFQTNKPFVSVRFGNVIGSRGSLIPIIEERIDAGQPVQITDKRATRYFMSIGEACQLVLEAAAQGQAGEIMVLDMGEPVNISTIVEKMVLLSGRSVDVEIVGLRPGEKLHEQLLSAEENLIPSIHPKIMRLQAKRVSPEDALGLIWF